MRVDAPIILPSSKQTEMKTKLLLATTLLLLCAVPVQAGEKVDSTYRWALGTDAIQWAMLGCINVTLEICTGQHWGILAGMHYNPFTYMRGTASQTQLRQATPVIGVRYWVDTPFVGWYFEGKAMASVYSVANVLDSGCFDGQAIATGLGAGWCKELDKRWRLTVGAGILAALHDTTYYMGPVCGRISDHKRGPALLPDLSVSINYLF